MKVGDKYTTNVFNTDGTIKTITYEVVTINNGVIQAQQV